ncbi:MULTISPECIES: hypothetical protein [Sphingobium]|jgi:hypothetical protein|uniref:hypothetical protein n=1 Tax=Sphingobium TaxID=165695 RepID=UPI00211BC59F|nr:hypothetical protein [Sphingobium yanoikuyae]WQE08121.1 hypothetical protein U0025_04335 [Sphingobium yanoikuyae]
MTGPNGTHVPPSEDVRRSPPEIELRWRDENYGSVYAVAAFRNYAGTFAWSERTHQRFRGCLKRAGFEFHHGRCSYIAKSGDRADRKRALCDELAAAGFKIIHGDVRNQT